MDIQDDDYTATVSEIVLQAGKLSETKKKVYINLSKIDGEINDLYHIVEYQDMTVQEQLILINLLKKKLIERRVLKEQITVLDSLISATVSGVADVLKNKNKNAKDREVKYKKESFNSMNRMIGFPGFEIEDFSI